MTTALAESPKGTREETGLGMARITRSGELAATAAAATAKAEIEAAYTIALHRPRSVADARTRILDACKRPGFAEVARYAKPVGDKSIVGPSIRFAELAIQCYRNIHVKSTVVYEDEDTRKLHITVTDLEGNMSYGKDVTLQKTVERRNTKPGMTVLGERQNSNGQKVYIVRATEDDLVNKTNALESKVIRQCGLRLIPSDIIEEAMDLVQKTLNNADAKDPRESMKKVQDAFAAIGVMPTDLEKFLNHPLAQVSPKELEELRGMYSAIRDGEATWNDYVNAPAKPISAALDLNDLKAGDAAQHVGVAVPTGPAPKEAPSAAVSTPAPVSQPAAAPTTPAEPIPPKAPRGKAK
jgi:hypothetical protein